MSVSSIECNSVERNCHSIAGAACGRKLRRAQICWALWREMEFLISLLHVKTSTTGLAGTLARLRGGRNLKAHANQSKETDEKKKGRTGRTTPPEGDLLLCPSGPYHPTKEDLGTKTTY